MSRFQGVWLGSNYNLIFCPLFLYSARVTIEYPVRTVVLYDLSVSYSTQYDSCVFVSCLVCLYVLRVPVLLCEVPLESLIKGGKFSGYCDGQQSLANCFGQFLANMHSTGCRLFWTDCLNVEPVDVCPLPCVNLCGTWAEFHYVRLDRNRNLSQYNLSQYKTRLRFQSDRMQPRVNTLQILV